MFKNFNDFILAIYAIDELAARWLAHECLKRKAGEHPSILIYSPLDQQEDLNLRLLFQWSQSPQGHAFWEKMNDDIRHHHLQIIDEVEEELNDNL